MSGLDCYIPLFPTHGGICTDEKNTEKFYFYLQHHKWGIWDLAPFLVRPDLERLLTKTKKEIRQAPILGVAIKGTMSFSSQKENPLILIPTVELGTDILALPFLDRNGSPTKTHDYCMFDLNWRPCLWKTRILLSPQ